MHNKTKKTIGLANNKRTRTVSYTRFKSIHFTCSSHRGQSPASLSPVTIVIRLGLRHTPCFPSGRPNVSFWHLSRVRFLRQRIQPANCGGEPSSLSHRPSSAAPDSCVRWRNRVCAPQCPTSLNTKRRLISFSSTSEQCILLGIRTYLHSSCTVPPIHASMYILLSCRSSTVRHAFPRPDSVLSAALMPHLANHVRLPHRTRGRSSIPHPTVMLRQE